jgi:hypothetical protein
VNRGEKVIEDVHCQEGGLRPVLLLGAELIYAQDTVVTLDCLDQVEVLRTLVFYRRLREVVA